MIILIISSIIVLTLVIGIYTYYKTSAANKDKHKKKFYPENTEGLLDYRYDNFYNEQEKQENLQHVLNRAKEILEYNNMDYINDYHPIFSYIRMFTLSIQTENAINIIKQNIDRLEGMNYKSAYFYFIDEYILFYKNRKVQEKLFKKPYIAELGHTPLISWVWKPNRIINSLLIIGRNVREKDNYVLTEEDRKGIDIESTLKMHPFQEQRNHKTVYIYPFGIVYTKSGNHSINSGILQSEGKLTVKEYIDVRHVYDEWTFDGTYLIKKKTGKKIKIEFKFGALFEIGRLLMDYPQIFPKEIRDSIN